MTLCLLQSAKFQTFMALDYRAGAAIMLVRALNQSVQHLVSKWSKSMRSTSMRST